MLFAIAVFVNWTGGSSVKSGTIDCMRLSLRHRKFMMPTSAQYDFNITSVTTYRPSTLSMPSRHVLIQSGSAGFEVSSLAPGQAS